jgi:hypothetical protein
MVARLECSLQLDGDETTSTGMGQEVDTRSSSLRALQATSWNTW